MIDPVTRELAKEPNFAAYTSLLPGGAPMTILTWVDCDDNHVLINTETHRRNFANVGCDPRVTVMIMNRTNTNHYVEVRGAVTEIVTGSAAREHIDTLAQKYLGTDYPGTIRSERAMLRISPESQRLRIE